MSKKEEDYTYVKPKKKDVYSLSPSHIIVEKGFNPREDYGDMDHLIKTIRENGVLVPLRGYKERGTNNYIITDGHRRLRAAKEVIKEFPDMTVPFIIDHYAKNPEKRILNVLVFNDGKPLNPLEEAVVINRLLNFGLTESEITIKTGKSGVYISNLKLLHNAPTKVKNLIKKDVISSTLAMEVLRENDYEKSLKIIEGAVIFAKGKGKKKVVKKDLDGSQGKVNSYSSLGKCFKSGAKQQRIVRKEKKDLYNFAYKILNGELNRDELDELFFEPIKE